MAKFRTKLKGGSKGKRWPKGMSSSSNPTTRKFRDSARPMFFQKNSGPSSLTVEALQRHDNKLNSFSIPRNNEDVQMDDETATESSYSSANSYASAWSGCTHMSFDRFLNAFRSDSQLHKEMLAVLAAVREVIVENQEQERDEPTSTEYFCAMMTTLEVVYKDEDQMQVAAILSLISMGITKVPEAVLKTKFVEITQKFQIILKDYMVSDNNIVVTSLLNILGYMLEILEPTEWNENSVKIFNTLLDPFCIHSKPKWRKCAQLAVSNIAVNECFKDVSQNLPAMEIAKFCEKTLNVLLGQDGDGKVLVSCLKDRQTTILHTLGLMKWVICEFPKKYIKSSCELVLKLITLNYEMVTFNGFEVLHCLFSAQKVVIPAKLNGQLISALYDYQPSVMDAQATHAWIVVMQKAHIHLSDVDLSMACEAFPIIFTKLTQLWSSEKSTIQTNVTYGLEIILKDAVSPACATKELVDEHKSKLAKVFGIIENCLSYQYNNVWHHVLHVISIMFEVGGPNCKDLFISVLQALMELRDSYKFTFNNELERAVGSAIRALGPEIVLEVIPLQRENGEFCLDRSWLLPVLRENVRNSSLDFFAKKILSLAIFCHKQFVQMAEANNVIAAHSSELLYFQLWNLLPSFCNNPTDIKDTFKNLARTLGTAITDQKDLRLSIMTSLRKLINHAKNSEDEGDLKELARFDKNYLPILFNVYSCKPIGSDEEGHRLAAFETIKLYLSIASADLTKELFTNCLKGLNTTSDDPEDTFIKESILDLTRALVPYQSVQELETLYNQCVKNLPQIKNRREQKKCYRIFEEICACESENCKAFLLKHRKEMQRLLKASMDSAAVSTKGARLRCFHYLIKAQPNLDHNNKLLQTVIPEVILACKDVNEKCRATAFEILNTIGEALIYKDQGQEFLTFLIAGFGGTTQMISCTVLAFSSILYNFSGTIGQENIKKLMENILTLLASPTRDIVRSCLAFIKTYLKVIPTPIIASSLPLIMKSFSGMSEDCKRNYRLKLRDILCVMVRKFGADGISPYIPQEDTVMFKRLRILRKIESRKARESMKKSDTDNEDDDEFKVNTKHKSVQEILADSDSDPDDFDSGEPKVKKIRKNEKYIQEGPDSIVDLADPTAFSKVTGSRPIKKAAVQEAKKDKDRGFKTAPDGRLIIKDDSSDSETDVRKKKNNSDGSDSDDESVEAKPVSNNKKRKLDTSSMASGFSASSSRSSKYRAGGSGIHRKLDTASMRSGASLGSQYKSKKAAGDMKKKGKVDPYAYIPLQRSSLNKRNKNKKKKMDYFLKNDKH